MSFHPPHKMKYKEQKMGHQFIKIVKMVYLLLMADGRR